MTHEDVQRWLDRYVAAWRSYDRDAIVALFTPDARYAYRPWDDPVVGAEAIADAWLAEQDEPGSWDASYRPLVIEGDTAVVKGETDYPAEGKRYVNLWVMRFVDGRCADFVEWYMRVRGPRERVDAAKARERKG